APHPPPTAPYPLSLHDALPISAEPGKIFYNDTVDPAGTDIIHQFFKSVSFKCGSGHTVINVYLCKQHFRVLFHKICADLLLDIDGIFSAVSSILSGEPDIDRSSVVLDLCFFRGCAFSISLAYSRQSCHPLPYGYQGRTPEHHLAVPD